MKERVVRKIAAATSLSRKKHFSDYLQHFTDVTGTKDPVNGRELLRLSWREIGEEEAVLSAASSELLACCTRHSALAVRLH